MTLTIHLPPEAEARLAKRAEMIGVDMSTLIERVLQAEAVRVPLEELLKPVHEAFDKSGMTEDELSELLVVAKKQIRADRRKRSRE